MKRVVAILLAIIVLFQVFPGSAAKGQDSIFLPVVIQQVSEHDALVAFYESTNGDDWYTNTDWLSDSVHHCEWYGVTCDSDEGLVVRIDLVGNNLQGVIPPEFGSLVNLHAVDLSSVEPLFGNFNNLKTNDWGDNMLLPIPPGDNNLSSIPPEFGNLVNLHELNLGGNNLSSLPPEFGNLVNLERLVMWGNNLSALPPEFGNLTSLESLTLYRNHLTSLPPEFGNLNNLKFLYLGGIYDGNDLTSLPAEFGNLTNLQELWLSLNSLSALPSEFGNLTNLNTLYLQGNNLIELPPEIINLTLGLLWLDFNPIPCLYPPVFFWYRNIPEHSPESFDICA